MKKKRKVFPISFSQEGYLKLMWCICNMELIEKLLIDHNIKPESIYEDSTPGIKEKHYD